jgi:hypothetical protein
MGAPLPPSCLAMGDACSSRRAGVPAPAVVLAATASAGWALQHQGPGHSRSLAIAARITTAAWPACQSCCAT